MREEPLYYVFDELHGMEAKLKDSGEVGDFVHSNGYEGSGEDIIGVEKVIHRQRWKIQKSVPQILRRYVINREDERVLSLGRDL
jgi:hypothetical protein